MVVDCFFGCFLYCFWLVLVGSCGLTWFHVTKKTPKSTLGVVLVKGFVSFERATCLFS